MNIKEIQENSSSMVRMSYSRLTKSPNRNCKLSILGTILVIIVTIVVVTVTLNNHHRKRSSEVQTSAATSVSIENGSIFNLSSSEQLHMVYFGNSILYANDCPGLIQKMIIEKASSSSSSSDNVNSTKLQLIQETCLRGGATLTSLWDDGDPSKQCDLLQQYVVEDNNDDDIAQFQANELVDWDFVVFNDQTQEPARLVGRAMSSGTIRTKYGPLLLHTNRPTPPIPVIIQTAAYRVENVQGSDDLGTFDEFTNALWDGVKEYQSTFNRVLFGSTQPEKLNDNEFLNTYGARIAPVGEAFRYVRTSDTTLYDKLYSNDNYHPSPYGTWLQACIVFITCFQQRPPAFNPNWMSLSSHHDDVPSTEEAAILVDVACNVTGLNC